jgi:hypothetical protein
MTTRSAIARVERNRAHVPAVPDPPPVESDGRQLARETTQAYLDELERYRRVRAAEPERLDPDVPPEWWELDAIRAKPPSKVTFNDLERLSRVNPAAVPPAWAAVEAAARDDLDGGWLAARALEHEGGRAWDRACFFAVRDRLRRAWLPRSAAEALLIDEIAQYEWLRQQWVAILATRTRDPAALARRKAQEAHLGERYQSAAEATVEAGRMVALFRRLYQDAVRQLLSVRRGGSKVAVFGGSGPVNVTAGPQLNVIVPARPDTDARPPDGPGGRPGRAAR